MKAVSARLCHSAFQELLSVGLPFCQKFPYRVWGGKPHRKISVSRKKRVHRAMRPKHKGTGAKKASDPITGTRFYRFRVNINIRR